MLSLLPEIFIFRIGLGALLPKQEELLELEEYEHILYLIVSPYFPHFDSCWGVKRVLSLLAHVLPSSINFELFVSESWKLSLICSN